MKTIHIVQCYDAFNPNRGWYPVMSSTSKQEASDVVDDNIKRDDKNEVRGKQYRIESCPFVNR